MKKGFVILIALIFSCQIIFATRALAQLVCTGCETVAGTCDPQCTAIGCLPGSNVCMCLGCPPPPKPIIVKPIEPIAVPGPESQQDCESKIAPACGAGMCDDLTQVCRVLESDMACHCLEPLPIEAHIDTVLPVITEPAGTLPVETP